MLFFKRYCTGKLYLVSWYIVNWLCLVVGQGSPLTFIPIINNRNMKTIKSIKTLFNHPAVGDLFQITFNDDSQVNIYEEWFFHLLPEYRGGSECLIGLELDENWIKHYSSVSA